MRFSGFGKDKKAKNAVNGVDTSEADKQATSEVQVKRSLCVNCGKVFTEPVQLTVQGKGSSDEYSACPHCFSRISSSDTEEKSDATEDSIDQPLSEERVTDSEEVDKREETEEPASVVEGEKPSGCAHYVGYLKTLSKGTPTPEECLTCTSLIKCKY